MKKNLIPLIIITLVMASCTVGSQGLFYTVEKEQKTEDADKALPNTVSVYDMAELSGSYYLATSSFYYKPNSSSSWQQKDISSKTGNRGKILSVLAKGTNLFIAAALEDYSGTSLFYATDPVNGAYSSVTGVAAGEEFFPGCLIPIQNGTGFYVATRKASTVAPTQFAYNIYHVSGTTATKLTITLTPAGELAHPPIQAAFNTGVALIATKSRLLTSGSENGTFTPETYESTDPIGGLTFQGAPTNKFFLTTAKGSLFHSADGAAWLSGSNNGFKVYTTDAKAPALGRLGVLSGTIFALSEIAPGNSFGTGYVEVIPDGGTWKMQAPVITVDANNYSSTVLSTASLTNYFIGSDNSLFIGTAGDGLWRRNDSDKKWAWE